MRSHLVPMTCKTGALPPKTQRGSARGCGHCLRCVLARRLRRGRGLERGRLGAAVGGPAERKSVRLRVEARVTAARTTARVERIPLHCGVDLNLGRAPGAGGYSFRRIDTTGAGHLDQWRSRRFRLRLLTRRWGQAFAIATLGATTDLS